MPETAQRVYVHRTAHFNVSSLKRTRGRSRPEITILLILLITRAARYHMTRTADALRRYACHAVGLTPRRLPAVAGHRILEQFS
jgi:hypothetical protein